MTTTDDPLYREHRAIYQGFTRLLALSAVGGILLFALMAIFLL